MSDNNERDRALEEEAERRIRIIEDPNYQAIPPMTKVDYVFITIICVVSLALLRYGATLA